MLHSVETRIQDYHPQIHTFSAGSSCSEMCILCAEPVGAKAPTFSSDTKSWTFVRQTGEDFALLCAAQAFPVPLIRYGLMRICRCVRAIPTHDQHSAKMSGIVEFYSMLYCSQSRLVPRRRHSPAKPKPGRLSSSWLKILPYCVRRKRFRCR